VAAQGTQNLEGFGDEGETISFESLVLNLINVLNKRFSSFSSSFVFFTQINW